MLDMLDMLETELPHLPKSTPSAPSPGADFKASCAATTFGLDPLQFNGSVDGYPSSTSKMEDVRA